MAHMGHRHRTRFGTKWLQPLIAAGWLAMTIPDKPRSSQQRYVTTDRGRVVLAQRNATLRTEAPDA